MDEADRIARGKFAVVSNNSPETVAENQEVFALQEAVSRLFANLLRLAAGRGSLDDLGTHLADLAVCPIPPAGLAGMRSFLGEEIAPDPLECARQYEGVKQSDLARWAADGSFERNRKLDRVMLCGFRLAASRLMNQPSQVSSAERRLCEAMDDYAKAVEFCRQRSAHG